MQHTYLTVVLGSTNGSKASHIEDPTLGLAGFAGIAGTAEEDNQDREECCPIS